MTTRFPNSYGYLTGHQQLISLIQLKQLHHMPLKATIILKHYHFQKH